MTNNDKKEQNIDYDFILGKGIADYSDGDLVIIDKIGAKPIEGTVKLDIVLMIYCKKGRIQGDINNKTWLAEEGDVVICLPNSYLNNYMMTPDFESKIIGLSYNAIRHNIPMTKDALDLLSYVAKNPIIHLDLERQALINKYYSIIEHKVQHPSAYFHKEIMHSIFTCAVFELCAIIAPHVNYTRDGGTMKQANLLFHKFIDLLAKNEGRTCSVKKYAEELCITPKYLSFISKSVSGKTALEWIHEYTVKAIERYLKHSNLSIKEIADRLGFPNLSFFGKFTKNYLGVSPTEYRRQQSMKKEVLEVHTKV
ncbi:helix-turn-helix domain-containing protein [Prevotella sp.]|uniref:helix-turn-helix domain-containing protein n=1 Tax=Prevotella sp. TaxID=59823 RepID=UPI00402700B9